MGRYMHKSLDSDESRARVRLAGGYASGTEEHKVA